MKHALKTSTRLFLAHTADGTETAKCPIDGLVNLTASLRRLARMKRYITTCPTFVERQPCHNILDATSRKGKS